MNKQQLDKIWNSTEIGWLQRHNKNSKKKEQRKIEITFYEKVTVHTIQETVWANKKDTTQFHAWDIISRYFPDTKDLPSKNYETRFVYD
jgi:hypothetical protein